jgi:hypothetical protein
MSDDDIRAAQETLARFFTDRSREEQMQLLAALERAGAAIYRSLASDETDAALRAELLRAAEREEENAVVLEATTGAA